MIGVSRLTVRAWRAAALAAALTTAAGCASVQPWQKQRLADRTMLFGADKLDGVVGVEVLPSREGSAGATGGFRGGCGCK